MTEAPDLDRTVDMVATRVESRLTDMIVRLTLLGLFVFWSLDLVAPFLPVVIWAVILAVALQPVHTWLARRLGGPAAGGGDADAGAARDHHRAGGVPRHQHGRGGDGADRRPQPGDAAGAATAGRYRGMAADRRQAQAAWSLAASNLDAAVEQYGPTLRPFATAILQRLASMSLDALLLCVSVIIAGFLYVSGPQLARGGRAFAERVVASRGAAFRRSRRAHHPQRVARGDRRRRDPVAARRDRARSAPAIPAAGLLAFAMLILCIIQIGPAPVLMPVIVWAWMTSPPGRRCC